MSNSVPARFRILGHKQLTCVTATSLANADIPNGTTAIMVQATGQAVRFRGDGVAPTTTVGLRLLTTESPLTLHLQSVQALSFIQESATALVEITFLGL